jgi:rhamnogalacturonan endolyase
MREARTGEVLFGDYSGVDTGRGMVGDWREEMLVRTEDSTAVRIYLSTEVTDRKLYTLMHDPQYRTEVARQQTTYNQPSYPSFYLGSDVNWSRVPIPEPAFP